MLLLLTWKTNSFVALSGTNVFSLLCGSNFLGVQEVYQFF